MMGRTGNAMRVVVVGAGAFGAWSALSLLRRGAQVTLVDAWGPGNSRSSSGGESRVLRGMYGADEIYVRLVVESLARWREFETTSGRRLYHPTGALWMFQGDDAYARSALPIMHAAGLPVDELSIRHARQQYPQIEFDGVRSVFLEREAGYLLARFACRTVVEAFCAEGGTLRIGWVRAPNVSSAFSRLDLSDGTGLEADVFVFACGPWLGEILPGVLGTRIRPTRQEVYYFGTPPTDGRFTEDRMPTWLDMGDRVFYGVPGTEYRGFKVADDTRGAPFDPTAGDRVASSEGLATARAFLARRFPALADAPLLESRVCQYENSPDGSLIVDCHPETENCWIAGGGSGHGFKLAPAIGEYIADRILVGRAGEDHMGLSRFESGVRSGTQFDHIA